MNIQESNFFGQFSNRIINGKEYTAYKVQIGKLKLEKPKQGPFEILVKTENRTICVNFYFSHKLNTLFVLTAHIVRKGEPSPKELAALKKLVQEIEEQDE